MDWFGRGFVGVGFALLDGSGHGFGLVDLLAPGFDEVAPLLDALFHGASASDGSGN